MPEEAPVMMTTLPATFSGKEEYTRERKNLKTRNGGKKNRRVNKVKGGATRFSNLSIYYSFRLKLIVILILI